MAIDSVSHGLSPLANLFVSRTFVNLVHRTSERPSNDLPIPIHFVLSSFTGLRVPRVSGILSVVQDHGV